MIIVTGGAGFIGSCFIWKLNQEGIRDILIVDEMGSGEKWKNLCGKEYLDYLEKDDFLSRFEEGKISGAVDAVFHLGACSSTTEQDASYLIRNNYEYSKRLAKMAFDRDIYFCYASSAATYGDGGQGYFDDESRMHQLRPLNMYGNSKLMFDLWLIRNRLLEKAVGLKYFNVFGPNEYHKGEMKSLVCKAYDQITETGKLRLFKSYRAEYKDGEQKRDFVYIKDVVGTMFSLNQKRNVRGIFNLGSGEARTWNDLASAIFSALDKKVKIEYIDMPEVIRDKYQYFTQAEMGKLGKAGVDRPAGSLEEGVFDYVQNYLAKSKTHL